MESTSGAGGVCGEQCRQCGYRLHSIFLNSGDHPIVPSILLHGRDVSSHVEAMQTMVDPMKTALEEGQANLSVAANRAKACADVSRREEKYEVGDEVVLAMRHLRINEHLPVKLRRRWIGHSPLPR